MFVTKYNTTSILFTRRLMMTQWQRKQNVLLVLN